MSEYLTPIVLITIMIIVNGIFVAAEFAIVSVAAHSHYPVGRNGC